MNALQDRETLRREKDYLKLALAEAAADVEYRENMLNEANTLLRKAKHGLEQLRKRALTLGMKVS